MNKSRKIYGSIFLFSLFILLLSGSRYVLAAVAAEAALLLLLRILLSVDANSMRCRTGTGDIYGGTFEKAA